MLACYWEIYEERKVTQISLDTFYSSSAQPRAGPEEVAMDGGVPHSIGVAMRIEVWLLLPGSLPCVFCVIVCLMFIVRSVLVLGLWFSSSVLYLL